MMDDRNLQSLSNDELLRRLSHLLTQSRRVEADLVAHIGEVDRRGLYAERACSSMFVYCLQVLHLSELEAYERIGAARAARRFPVLLEMLRDGRLHLSGIGKLAPHLTDENAETLLARAAHKTKAQIEELVAEIRPKPDVPPSIRKLPSGSPATASPLMELGPDRVASEADGASAAKPTALSSPPRPVEVPETRPRVEPLAPSRYKITFTASKELRDKLERLQAHMKVDLAAVIEAAVTEKLEKLEAKRYGETKKPRKDLTRTDTSARSRYVPAAVRRAVSRRDAHRCAFVDREGRRCAEWRNLEFHHDDPFGRGGEHDPARMRLLCPRHNLLLAERDYGKEVMARYRGKADRVGESTPRLGFRNAGRNRPSGGLAHRLVGRPFTSAST